MVDRGIQTLKKDRAAPRDGARRDNADKFQHNKDLAREGGGGRGRLSSPTNAARSFNPQYACRLGAVDSMTVRSTEGLLKLALPAPQGSGAAAD